MGGIERYLGPPNEAKIRKAADVSRLPRRDTAPGGFTGANAISSPPGQARQRIEALAKYADPGRRLDPSYPTGRAGSVPLDQSMIEAIATGSQARFPLARTEAEQELYGGPTPDTAMGYSPRQQAAARLAGLQLSPGEMDSASGGAATAPIRSTGPISRVTGTTPSGPTMGGLESLAFDAARQTDDPTMAALESLAFDAGFPMEKTVGDDLGIGGDGDGGGDGGGGGGGGGGAFTGDDGAGGDGDPVDFFADASADINSAFNITTQDLTDKIRELVKDGKISARLATADLVQQIKDSADRRKTQIKSIKDTSEEALKKQDTNRKAIQTQLSATARDRMATMQADTEAQIAAGRLSLGPQLTSEFEEVAAMVTGLTDSVAAGHEGSMARIEAVANLAAAQRLAAPALLMADAENALGDEKFRLENEAQASLLQTLNSLTEQENALVLQEAQRIEAFNNKRDFAEASALVSLGMAKLQTSIDTVQRAEDKAERMDIRLAAEKTAATAAAESKRRWEAEFQQKENTLETAKQQFNQELTLKQGQAVLTTQQKAAQNDLISSMTSYTAEQVGAMTDTQRNSLFSNVQSNLDDIKRAASVRPGTFRWLVDDLGTDPAIAGMAVSVAEQMRVMDIANEAGDAAAAQAAQDTMDAMLEPYYGLDSTMQRYETADMREIKSLANTAFTALPRLDAPANYEDFGENVYGLYGVSDSTRQLEAFVR